jgi:hypothetical protein
MLYVKARQEATMAPLTLRRRSDSGFAVVQTLIVLGIAVVVAAIAIPVYATKAKDSVLQQNAGSLVLQIKGCVALDLDPTYVADGDADGSLSTTIARALRAPGAGSWGHYVNPLSGSDRILCQTASPTSPGDLRPAVWITDDQRYAFAAVGSSATMRSQLAGTLLVVFTPVGGPASAVDIFYINGAGRRSASAVVLAL